MVETENETKRVLGGVPMLYYSLIEGMAKSAALYDSYGDQLGTDEVLKVDDSCKPPKVVAVLKKDLSQILKV